MNDHIGEGEQKRNRRLFQQVVAWLLFEGRRPGMIGTAVAFEGRAESSPASLQRIEGGWEFVTHDRREPMTTADALGVIGGGKFFPRTVDVVPDLAEMLFMESISRAEESLRKLDTVAGHIGDLVETDIKKDPFPWVLATSELDRSVRASISAIVLAVAAGEAQVNRWAGALGNWEESEDRLAVAEKCRVLADRVGNPVSLGQPPYQRLHQATKSRNSLVHSSPVPEQVPVTGARAWVPGSSISIEARETCLAVRSSLVDLARRLGVPPPEYLAYCPPGPADDASTWRSASLMTGIRPDPDFPARREP